MFKLTLTTLSFLFPLLLLSAAFASGGNDAVERFRWTGNSDAVVYSVVLIAFFAFVTIIITYIIQEKIRRESIKEYVVFKFDERVKDTHLNIAEQTMLKSITWAVAPKMLADVFGSLVIFETAVDTEMSKLIEKFGADSQRAKDNANMISNIRRKLGFNKLIAEKALESTRNIELGQIISVSVPPEDANCRKMRVLNNNEIYFEAEDLEVEDFYSQDKIKSSATVKFTRQQDATYCAELDIHSINTGEKTISFFHTITLERHQARKYARIFIDTPVQCRIIKRTDEKATPAAGEILEDTVLCDISGGGLSFNANVPLGIDDIAIFSTTLQKQKFAMKGKIISVSAQESGHYVFYKHRVVFYNPKQSDIERLVKFIYEKQRERIQLG